MKVCENLEWFIEGKIDETYQILCPECNEWSSAGEWKDCEPYCEVCGNHVGIICPLCDEDFDHCFDDDKEFKTRKINE